MVNAHVRDGRIVRISTDPRKWTPEVRAAARLRARLRPARAAEPPGPAVSTRCGGWARAAAGSSSAIGWDEALDEVAGQMRRIRDTLRPRRHPRLLAHRQPVDAAQPLDRQAPALHVRRLHRAVDQHLGRGRGLRGPPDLRGQGRLQERGPRAHRLRQLAPDPHVGLEPGRRHLRHRHAAVPEAGQEARRQDHLRRSAAHAHELGAGRSSTSSSARRPTPRRCSRWPT